MWLRADWLTHAFDLAVTSRARGKAARRSRTAVLSCALAVCVALMTGCSSVSADEIALALEADGAEQSVAECIGAEAVRSDLSTDSLERLAEEGITDEAGEDVQYLEDDTAILQALVTACLGE